MDNKKLLSDKLSSRYAKLETDRRPFLDRARQCAVLTIPAIMPPAGFGPSSQLPTPYQSLGARGVRTLASKLLLSLFPSSMPFFNYRLDDLTVQKLGNTRGEFEKALASREKAVCMELDTCVFRPSASVCLQHLVVTGNFCLHVPPDQKERAQGFRLDQYVVRRDNSGNLLELIIQESLDFSSVPEEIKKVLLTVDKYKEKVSEPDKLSDSPVRIFTVCYKHPIDGKWYTYQEAEDVFVTGSDGSYLDGELPYLVLRFSFQPGEDYGRGYVEEYLGDLDSLEALSETLVEGSAASARILFLVNPGGMTNIQVIEKAPNGAVRSGRAEDVQAMQVGKQQDLTVAKGQAEEIANRLAYAFLLHSAVQRQGERVTAEEIRYMAAELDDGLGGVYTLFAADFQLPSVRLFEKRMEKRLGQQKLPKETVHPVVVAGLEAIGRGHDQRNLRAFITDVYQTLTPPVAGRWMHVGELISRTGASYSVDMNGLVKTPDEVAAEQQQEMAMAMMQKLGPNAINQAGGIAQTGMQAGAEGEPPPEG